MSWTNCPNCGAVREPAESRCPYCGTPYPRDRKVAEAVAVPEPITIHMDTSAITAAVIREYELGILTPNEARRLLGLE